MSSDTEPESDCEFTSDHVSLAVEESDQPSIFTIDEALEIIESSEVAYAHRSSLSHILTRFLDTCLSEAESISKDQIRTVFQRLVTGKSLSKLLHIRSLIRNAHIAIPVPHITWVDEVLAHLGALTLSLARNPDRKARHQHTLKPLKTVLQQDAIRAASQLPDRLELFPSLLSANYVSPGAKRLSLRLLFANVIMQSVDFITEDLGFSLDDFASSLECSIDQFVEDDVGEDAPRILQDKTSCALFVNLYATVDFQLRCQKQHNPHLKPLKPRYESHLLALLHGILRPDDKFVNADSEAADDISQASLLHWGKVVPWSWLTWLDIRLANTEPVVALTILWLTETDFIFFGECSESSTLQRKEVTFACFAAISNVLYHFTSQLKTSDGIHNMIPFDLLDKACWFLNHLIDILECSHPHHTIHMSRICRSILCLAVLPKARSSISDPYLQILTKIDKATMARCLTELQVDRQISFSNKIDNAITHVKRVLKHAPSTYGDIPTGYVLGLMTVLCNAATKGVILRESAASLFLSLQDLVLERKAPKELLAPMLTALIAAEQYFRFPIMKQNSEIWKSFLGVEYTEFATSLALAQYIIHGNFPQGRLLLTEAFDYLRSVILTILNRSMPTHLEPLAILACPTLCAALLQLLTDSSGSHEKLMIRDMFIKSPWTTTLHMRMSRLLFIKQGHLNADDVYSSTLRGRIMGVGSTLIGTLAADNTKGVTSIITVTVIVAKQKIGLR